MTTFNSHTRSLGPEILAWCFKVFLGSRFNLYYATASWRQERGLGTSALVVSDSLGRYLLWLQRLTLYSVDGTQHSRKTEDDKDKPLTPLLLAMAVQRGLVSHSGASMIGVHGILG